jgi:hypothetical protein
MKGQIEEIDSNCRTLLICASYTKAEEKEIIRIFKENRDRNIKLLNIDNWQSSVSSNDKRRK